MSSQEQIDYLEALLRPYYNLETGEALQDVPPFETEFSIYWQIKQAQADDLDVFV